mgnify:CR=1 FL=1
MRYILILLSAGFLLLLGGCDGHGRALYFKEPQMNNPRWHAGRTIINIDQDYDVEKIVSTIAKKLGLKEVEENTWIRDDSEGSVFRLILEREDEMWCAILLDWPSFIRSDISKEVESEIRNSLDRGNAAEQYAPANEAPAPEH